MNINFDPLCEHHSPLMLKWLQSPHVKKWYDSDITHTLDTIEKKYTLRAQDQSSLSASSKSIQAYIILVNQTPIGYIQMYNAHHFSRTPEIDNLPSSLGAFDIFIGEPSSTNIGIGSKAIKLFLENYMFPLYRYVFADPEYTNEIAVRAYEKAGLTIIQRKDSVFWMLAHKQIVRLSGKALASLEVAFQENFLPNDKLWIFGSRANLSKKGGDLDLYIETHALSIDDAIFRKSQFLISLEESIGEQKIDIVVNTLNYPYPLLIHHIALTQGVQIV